MSYLRVAAVPLPACSISALLVLAPLPLSAAKTKPPLHPINLNTATDIELQQVPGTKHMENAQVFDRPKSTRAKASAERAPE